MCWTSMVYLIHSPFQQASNLTMGRYGSVCLESGLPDRRIYPLDFTHTLLMFKITLTLPWMKGAILHLETCNLWSSLPLFHTLVAVRRFCTLTSNMYWVSLLLCWQLSILWAHQCLSCHVHTTFRAFDSCKAWGGLCILLSSYRKQCSLFLKTHWDTVKCHVCNKQAWVSPERSVRRCAGVFFPRSGRRMLWRPSLHAAASRKSWHFRGIGTAPRVVRGR